MTIFSSILSAVGIAEDITIPVVMTGHDPILPTPFKIGEAGAAALAAVGYAAAQLWSLKTNFQQQVSISLKDAAIAQRSYEYLLLNGKKIPTWNPISGFYQTGDNRWIQFHCNFPHHLQGVLDILSCDNDKAAVTRAVKNWNAEVLEQKLAEVGMCAAMVRTADEWQSHPQAQAVAKLPLMEIIKIGDSQPEPLPAGDMPLTGIKALDLTRVIAGPVCGKTLAEFGATVMLVSSPHLPSVFPLVIDTGSGKLSTYLDLMLDSEKATLFELTKQADIFLQSYRPGGLAKKGFSPDELAQYRPGIIYVSLSAYSHVGSWANRRGFDSLVQSATGIVYEQGQGIKPQHLPAQSLDYITGYLAAFGAMEALRRRATVGGSYLVRVSLVQTAHWFKALGRVSDFASCVIPDRNQIENLLTQTNSDFGKIEYLLPVLNLSQTPPYYSRPPVPLGADLPRWP